jgi:hypothetical protein
MNSRFEPDGYDIKTNVQNLVEKVKLVINAQGNSNVNRFPATPEEIDRMINVSNWSTRLAEAHQKLNADYKPLDQNDEFLEQNYMK